ncbi:type VI secretion lipoprotein TssJ [Polyangium jinanense]|uniref:Type VI secretion lipoprotein TssJ n=1 Tax=Polyangium jinanense TaxID=2829994 RepID=A0A9X3WVK3_9BACT|nr:type VI secretion lipoprotein TssJ [Polyangium jinanense]MDC3953875.1 type VI secretion lipoprotein TssJ [Polyangium jinanense]MDC3979004.1 type VI secretion lipoprotein TssJ [Polyangium jinanense]
MRGHASLCGLTALLASMLGAGCASSNASQVELVLRPAADANGARSVYVLARAIDEKTFGAESYESVAARVTTPDESVQTSVVVLPGQTKVIQVPVPEKGTLAIYALLERPDRDAWRVLLSSPPPEKIEVRIERSRLCRVSKSGEVCVPEAP